MIQNAGGCCCGGGSGPGDWPICDCTFDTPNASLCFILKQIEFISNTGTHYTDWWGLDSTSPTFTPPPIHDFLSPETPLNNCESNTGAVAVTFLSRDRGWAMFLFVEACCIDNDHRELNIECTVGPGNIECEAIGLPALPEGLDCTNCWNVTPTNANFELIGYHFAVACDLTKNSDANLAYDEIVTVPSLGTMCDCTLKLHLQAYWVSDTHGGSCVTESNYSC